MGDHKGQIFSQELQLTTWPVIINGFGICYMFNVCVCCTRHVKPSSRDLVYSLLGCFVSEKSSKMLSPVISVVPGFHIAFLSICLS